MKYKGNFGSYLKRKREERRQEKKRARRQKKKCGRTYYDDKNKTMVECGRKLRRIIDYKLNRDSKFCPKHGFNYMPGGQL